MARTRYIKPDFYSDTLLAKISLTARYLYIGMFGQLDRQGVTLDDAQLLKREIFPYDDTISRKKIEGYLAELVVRTRLIRFTHADRKYFYCPTFSRHQNFHVAENPKFLVPAEVLLQLNQQSRSAVSPVEAPHCSAPVATRNRHLARETSLFQEGEVAPPTTSVCTGSETTEPQTAPGLAPCTSEARIVPAPENGSDNEQRIATNDPLPTTDGVETGPARGGLEPQAKVLKAFNGNHLGYKVWQSYRDAYQHRYGQPPILNGRVYGQVVNYCGRLPAEEAPIVASFYLSNGDQFYLKTMHPFGLLLKDAEKLRTEWITGRTVNAVQAKRSEQAEANAQAMSEYLARQQGNA